jgi:hypothetical protein
VVRGDGCAILIFHHDALTARAVEVIFYLVNDQWGGQDVRVVYELVRIPIGIVLVESGRVAKDMG